ncbi:hypothetical protein [Acinetobacter lanii]|uniref:Uncharacterized protein n=1 Tax=Acinetobacter lanii TaxID=2715163 RepID=A0A6G8S6I2_9GAMM|nr:hypothetical protein [Acinetobacter lanii]QIO09720.1 hypothetical protein G8D99_12380 [Acinetobacter lanii]
MKSHTVVEESVEISIVDALKLISGTVMALASFLLLFAYVIRQFLV